MSEIKKKSIFNYSFPDNFRAFIDEENGVILYNTDCLNLMDILIKEYPDGISFLNYN